MANGLDEFNLQLSGELDQQQSKKNINDDIATLERAIEHLKVQAEIDPNSVKNIAKQLSDILNQKVVVDNIQIDATKVSKTAQQVGQKIGDAVEKSVQQSLSIDDVIDKQVTNLMAKYSIAGKKGSKAFEEIRQAVVNYRQELASVDSAFDSDDIFDIFSNSADIRKVTSALADHMKVADATKDTYASLAEYIKHVNNSGTKIHLPESIRQEYGDDFSSMRSQLGKAFTTGHGGDFESFITELNGQLGNVIDMSQGAEAAFGDLVQKVNSAKGGNFLSGDELFKQGYLDRNEIERDITSAIDIIEEEEKKLAQTSTSVANTVVQNEQKKQQAHEGTAEKVEEEIQRSERLAKAQTKLKESYDQISKNYDVSKITFGNNIDADKDAHDYFKKLLKDEEAVIYTTSKLGELGGLKEFTTHIKRASGELESLRFILDDDPESDNGRFRFLESTLNDKGYLQQVEQIEKTYTNYLTKLNDLKTKYSEASIDYSGFETVLKNFREGTVDVNNLKLAFNELSNSAKLGVQSLKSQDSSFDPIQQALNNMRDMPSMLKTLEASMSGVKDKTSLAGISVKDLTSKYEELQKEMTANGGKVPLTDQWTQNYRELMSTVTSATKQVDALKKAEASDNSQTTKQANYYSSILASYRQMYDIKKKLLSAGEEEAKVLESQRKSLSASIASNYKQLGKQGLTDKDWQSQVDTLKKEQEYQLNLTQARISDKNAIQEQTQAQRDYANALKEQESLQKNLDKIQHSLEVGDYDAQIETIKKGFVSLSGDANEAETHVKGLRDALQSMHDATDDNGRLTAEKNYRLELEKTDNQLTIAKAKAKEYVDVLKVQKLRNDIQDWLRKNTAATKEAKDAVKAYLATLDDIGHVSQSAFNEAKQGLDNWDTQMRVAGKLGKSPFETFKEGAKSFASWTLSSGSVMEVVNAVKQGVDELKDLDDILTEISKTSDLTKQQLKELGDTAFESASKYGKSASDYLTGVQEMYRAGFDNASEMAELSVLAQSAGDMETNLANDYLLATNAAYKYKGSIEELNKVLDSQNYITNNAAISMKDIADATTETASVAAQYGVQIDELSALIATATANTRESGSEVGTALKAILINLQDTTSKPVTETFDALGISMTKVVNGAETLKTPIELIHELADAYNSLPEGDVMRANILNEIGQKRHANTLASILSDMEGYRDMLDLYNSTSANDSAFREAQKSAENWSGTWNKVKNTWSDLLQNFANTDVIVGALNVLNDFIGALDKLGAVGTLALGGGLFAGIKNVGQAKMWAC